MDKITKSELDVLSIDEFIKNFRDWDSFFEYYCDPDFFKDNPDFADKRKGDIFDRFTQLYLINAPEYRIKLKNVWLREEVPTNIKRKLNIPDNDFGIDQFAETHDGDFLSLQAKF